MFKLTPYTIQNTKSKPFSNCFGNRHYILFYLGLVKFDLTREHNTNPIRFLWVLVEYNDVCVRPEKIPIFSKMAKS